MEYTAKALNVRVTPRKARAVADVVKKMTAKEAITKLPFLAKSASEPVLKVIKSAMANARKDNLTIKNILIDEGLKMKRRDTSHGARFGGGVITKRTSHIKVVLTDG